MKKMLLVALYLIWLVWHREKNNMKKEFEVPKLIIIEFNDDEILTAVSGTPGEDPDYDEGSF